MSDSPSSPVARTILIGNEKGGSGKSTTAMHLCVALLRSGLQVATIDLDIRQGTLTRYIENRQATMQRQQVALPMPHHQNLHLDTDDAGLCNELQDRVAALREQNYFIIIDSPGANTAVSRHAHCLADTLVTPLNDSFVDLDLLARLDGETLEILGPGPYAELVWEQRRMRAENGLQSLEWIAMRNRLGSLGSRSGRSIDRILNDLAQRFRFRLAPGLSERVVYRELFPSGLTLLDLREAAGASSISHVSARAELRVLLDNLAPIAHAAWRSAAE